MQKLPCCFQQRLGTLVCSFPGSAHWPCHLLNVSCLCLPHAWKWYQKVGPIGSECVIYATSSSHINAFCVDRSSWPNFEGSGNFSTLLQYYLQWPPACSGSFGCVCCKVHWPSQELQLWSVSHKMHREVHFHPRLATPSCVLRVPKQSYEVGFEVWSHTLPIPRESMYGIFTYKLTPKVI